MRGRRHRWHTPAAGCRASCWTRSHGAGGDRDGRHPASSLSPCRAPAPSPRGKAIPAATPLALRERASPRAPSLPSQASVPRPSYGGFSFPLQPPRVAAAFPCRRQRRACDALPAITTGRAVTLQQTSPLSPATNQGQAAALLDRACRYVLLLLMSFPARLMGTRRRTTVARRRLGPAAHPRVAALRSSSPVAAPALSQGRRC